MEWEYGEADPTTAASYGLGLWICKHFQPKSETLNWVAVEEKNLGT